MKFPRIIIIPGALACLLLSGGCTVPPKPAVSASATSSAAVDSHHPAEPIRAEAVLRPSPEAASRPPAMLSAQKKIDLWQRLRNNFRLANLEQNQRRLHYYEKWFSSRPKYLERLAERAYWFLPYVIEQVEKRGMPGEIALLPAIESAFRADAVSHARAVGLWQFIPSTGRRFGLRQDWWLDERRDLVHSTQAALDYLDFLEKEYDGDWELALAAYNAGEGSVWRRVKRNLKHNKPVNYSSLKWRRETANYIPKLYAMRNIINQPQKFGITLKPLANRHNLAVIDARSQTDLSVAASLVGLDSERLRFFNQGYKRGTTSPSGPHNLVVPVEYADKMLAALDQLSVEERLRWARYRVRNGDYLGRIAHKYDVSVAAIVDTNHLRSHLIFPGQELRIPISAGRYQYAKSTSGNDLARDGAKVHRVRSGDSLWRIARRYGVSIAELTHWNQIPRSALLHPGQSLVVGR